MAKALGALGHQGIFVNVRPVAVPEVAQAVRQGPQALDAALQRYVTEAGTEVLPNVLVISPPEIPEDPRAPARFLLALLQHYRERHPVLFYSTPFTWVEELAVVPESVPVIYDCADEHTAFSYARKGDMEMENLLVTRSTLLVATASRLYANKTQLNPHSYYLPNAVDPDDFAGSAERPPELVGLDGPAVGFVGGVSEWVDLELVEQLARRLPHAHLFLIGPGERPDLKDLLQRNHNIRYLGRRPYDQLRHYLGHFQVGIIPFYINELTLSVSPLKLFEYFACGLPTAATNLPDIYPYAAEARLGTSHEEFIAGVTGLLDSPPPRERLLAVARRETWLERARELVALLDAHGTFDFAPYSQAKLNDLCNLYQGIVNAQPDNAVAMAELARLHCLQGRAAEMTAWAGRAAGVDPERGEAHLFVALGQLAAGQYADGAAAAERYADLLEADSATAHDIRQLLPRAAEGQSPAVYALRALLLRHARLYALAGAVLAEAPPDAAVELEAAHLDFALGRLDAAIDRYTGLDNPLASATYCANLSYVFRRARRLDDAEHALMRLGRLCGFSEQITNQLAQLYWTKAYWETKRFFLQEPESAGQ